MAECVVNWTNTPEQETGRCNGSSSSGASGGKTPGGEEQSLFFKKLLGLKGGFVSAEGDCWMEEMFIT